MALPQVALVSLFLALKSGFAIPAQEEEKPGLKPHELSIHYGFSGLEIFKIKEDITQLWSGDFNGDGRRDLVLANNAESSLEVLLQREAPGESKKESLEVNEMEDDWRFRRESATVLWKIVSLRPLEITGDQHLDVVFLGNPFELVILPGKGDGTFAEPITRRISDGLDRPGALDIGDVNGDRRIDVVLATQKEILLFEQRKDGGLEAPTAFSLSGENVVTVQLADVNGDGRLDLAFLTDDKTFPLRVRLQQEQGGLGPIHRVKLPALDDGRFMPMSDDKSALLVGIETATGRLKRWSFQQGHPETAKENGAVNWYPLPRSEDSGRRPFVIGDLTGDGLADVATADAKSAELILLVQNQQGGFGLPTKYGGQVGTRDAALQSPREGEKGGSLLVLSSEEQAIAFSRFDGNRLTFPKPLAIRDKPLVLDAGAVLTGDSGPGVPALAYVAQDAEKKHWLRVMTLGDSGKEGPSGPPDCALPDLEDTPEGLRFVDADQDGRTDVAVFVPYSSLRVCLQEAAGAFAPMMGAGKSSGLVKQAKPEAFARLDVDGDGKEEVLLAQGAFIRALRVNGEGGWEVVDQYNAPEADAEMIALCKWPGGEGGASHLAAYDRRSREVLLFVPLSDKRFAFDRSIEVGAMEPQAMVGLRLGKEGHPGILLAERQRVAVIAPNDAGAQALELSSYAPSIQDGRFWSFAGGDVNHDGITDVAVVDVAHQFIEILSVAPGRDWVRALKFRVFSRKQFQFDRGGVGGEPRWVHIADVTSDQVEDLILIAHDRVLLYSGQ